MIANSVSYSTLPDQVFIGMKGGIVPMDASEGISTAISKLFETTIEKLDDSIRSLLPHFSKRPSAIIYNQEELSDGNTQLVFQVGYFCSVKEYKDWFHSNDALKQQCTTKGVQLLSIAGGSYAKSVHKGKYDGLFDSWMRLFGQLKEEKHVVMDWNPWTNWEWNLKTKNEESDPNNFVTELWIRVLQ